MASNSVPLLLQNGLIAGPVTPATCNPGIDPIFLNETTGQLFACTASGYQPLTGGGGGQPQSPWASNISAAGFNLTGAGAVSCASITTTGDATVGGNASVTGNLSVTGTSTLAGPVTMSNATVIASNLPTVAPVAGSKQLWVDTAAGNVVKCAV